MKVCMLSSQYLPSRLSVKGLYNKNNSSICHVTSSIIVKPLVVMEKEFEFIQHDNKRTHKCFRNAIFMSILNPRLPYHIRLKKDQNNIDTIKNIKSCLECRKLKKSKHLEIVGI